MNIKELARLAGVSTATISNVINDKTRSVSEETRQRVLEIIKETGYVPNGIAKSLRKQCSNTIGIITEDIAHFHVGEIVSEINRYAKQENYIVILHDLCQRNGKPDRVAVNSASNLFLKEKVEGIIYLAWQDRDVDGLIDPINIPLVYAYCLSDSDSDERSWVNYDNVGSMLDIMNRVYELNHRKIAVLKGGDKECYPSNVRFQVYLDKLKEWDISYRDEYVKTGHWLFEDGRRFYHELMALQDPPTVVVSLNDEMAAGFISESMNTDRKILDKVSIVGYNGFSYCRFLYPTLATVKIPLKEIGFEATKQLINEIQKKGCGKRRVILPCVYQDGDSLREMVVD